MNRKQAWHALRMSKVEDIVMERLNRVDEDTFLYTDYTTWTQYTVFDSGTPKGVEVTAIPFKVAAGRLNQEFAPGSPLVRDYDADKALEEMGICSTCGQPHEECICGEDYPA